MSHSHVVEWISGSFIQSHWPWPILWPSSMFSMLLAAASPSVPSNHPGLATGGDHETGSQLEAPLNGDGPADVGPVLRADANPRRRAGSRRGRGKRVEIGFAQMGVFGDIEDGHQSLGR